MNEKKYTLELTQKEMDLFGMDAEEPADYPEVDAEELEEIQRFCDFIERMTR